jgi:outer membrane lipopolysaccharide assembly protein LptE/RlpB
MRRASISLAKAFPASTRFARMCFTSTCLLAIVLLPACGYHTSAHSAHLPDNVKTIAIPSFVNQTQTFRIEQVLTGAVVREMTTRTRYQLLHEAGESADATLRGIVLSTSTSPLAYDSKTGRATSVLVTISMKVTLTGRDGKVLFENPSYLFHEQYEVSRELSSFFEEDSPAMERLSRDFARTLVSSILEAF